MIEEPWFENGFKKHQIALTLLRNQSRLLSEQWEDQVEVELAEEKV